MLLTNNQIYTYATNLMSAFQDTKQTLPVKVNFYLQKNKTNLLAVAQEIEQARLALLERYGTLDEETNKFILNPETIDEAKKELADLLDLEQDITIYKVNIDSFGDNLTLTTGQMEALLFMID